MLWTCLLIGVCVYAPQTVHAAKQLKSFLCLKLPALFLPDVLFFSMTVHRCILFDGIWLRMYPATMVCHESRVLFSIELYVQQQRFLTACLLAKELHVPGMSWISILL